MSWGCAVINSYCAMSVVASQWSRDNVDDPPRAEISVAKCSTTRRADRASQADRRSSGAGELLASRPVPGCTDGIYLSGVKLSN